MRTARISTHVSVYFILALAFSGCFSKASSSASVADSSTGTGDGSSGSGGSGGTTTPTYGMACTSYQGGDYPDSQPVSYISAGAINGTTISSITFYGAFQTSGFSAYTGTQSLAYGLTLTAYGCPSSSSLGSVLGTVTASTGFQYMNYKPLTFTFSPAITIPTNCTTGEDLLAFKFSGSDLAAYSTDVTFEEAGGPSSSCFLHESSDATGDVAVGRVYSATIVASP